MPTIQIPPKLLPILTTKARIIVLVGGRGSAKSETVGRTLLMKCQTERADILCGREFQNSIDDSVHKLIKGLIPKLDAIGFIATDKKIDCSTGGGFRFKGFARSPESVKSAQDFKYSWIEEAQNLSQQSIDDLLPTIRSSGSKLIFTANPQASNDPFSKRFIIPYKRELDTNGYYEDEMHLIIKINWRDNPWFPKELELQRQWDFNNLPRAKYDHIWEGEFNDSVEDALIYAEWFDACIDAHVKLGFEPIGAIMAAHDPSDEGSDSKGFAVRHGSVVTMVEEKTTGNVNQGMDWALSKVINCRADCFTWDCDGMGIGLGQQVANSLEGKKTTIVQFKGSEGADNPEAIFEPIEKTQVQEQRTNKQSLKNKRAQYYFELRKRVFNTYNAVINSVYCDPDKMISFSSDIKSLQTLRSELCRMPIKPNGNGLFELYTKPEMKTRFKFASPNLADAVMMLMRKPYINLINGNAGMPQPMKQINRRR
jgi:phage terminase large subunit